MKLLKTILALTALLFFTSTNVHAQHSLEGYSLDQLKSELNDAQIYQALGRAKVAADGTRGCYQYNNEMLNVRQSLINLTQQYEGRADSVYHQKRGELQEQFRLAKRGYEDCYNLTLADYPALSYAGVRTLADFKSKVGALNPKFSDKGDIAAYISAIENAIENLSQQRGKRVGVIESVFKTVEISRGGNGQWSPLAKGSTVHILDELRTGPRGRIRIQFEDRLSSSNAGPTVVNIGSDSHVKIEKFLISFNNPPKREGAISLLRGTVRAFTKNWGPRSQFSVRAGASVCGIRGTEVAVSYDPITYTATHVLDHGDAFIEAGRRKINMTPRTSVTLVGDQFDEPVAVSETMWSNILNSTDASGDLDLMTTGDQRSMRDAFFGNKGNVQNEINIGPEEVMIGEEKVIRELVDGVAGFSGVYSPPDASPKDALTLSREAALVEREQLRKDALAKLDDPTWQYNTEKELKSYRIEARRIVRRYISRSTRYDVKGTLDLLSGQQLRTMQGLLKTKNMSEIVKEQGNIYNMTTECAACQSSSRSDADCFVQVRINYEDKSSPDMALFAVNIYPETKITSTMPAVGEALNTYEKYGPVCSETDGWERSMRVLDPDFQ